MRTGDVAIYTVVLLLMLWYTYTIERDINLVRDEIDQIKEDCEEKGGFLLDGAIYSCDLRHKIEN